MTEYICKTKGFFFPRLEIQNGEKIAKIKRGLNPFKASLVISNKSENSTEKYQIKYGFTNLSSAYSILSFSDSEEKISKASWSWIGLNRLSPKLNIVTPNGDITVKRLSWIWSFYPKEKIEGAGFDALIQKKRFFSSDLTISGQTGDFLQTCYITWIVLCGWRGGDAG